MTTSGVLLVDKAGAMTSHDVVARARRLLAQKRVGHAGTLDPMATGLLVLGVGPATRLLRFAQAGTKRYVGTARLGVATDSLDADGAVLARRPVPAISPEALARATLALTGQTSQTPPMVSALKVGGERLHALARRGVEVDRPARVVTVSRLEVAGSGPEEWTFDVTCSPGTYVRVLIADLAESLGTLAHLTSLRRLASGDFCVADALSLEQVAERVAAGEDVVRPALELVGAMARARLDDALVARVRRGQRVELALEVAGDEVAATDGAGELVGVLARRGDAWQPALVLPEVDAGTGR